MTRPAVLVSSMKGLGDNIFQRAFLKTWADTHDIVIDSPWPELYSDLPVRFLEHRQRLRTQAKNYARQPVGTFLKEKPPTDCHVRVAYGANDLEAHGIAHALRRQFRCEPSRWDMPNERLTPRGYVVVRPATVRREWYNSARNPLPEYIAFAAARARGAGYRVVLLADLQEHAETAVGDLPQADEEYIHGEKDLPAIMDLVRGASGVIGGVGWSVPMAISYGVPLLTILGGHGGHNAPRVITDPTQDLSRVVWATPDNFCMCAAMRHDCDKRISDLQAPLDEFLEIMEIERNV